MVSLVFAYAHRAQGITGVLDNAIAGALFATLYFVSGRNLWLPILTHGVIDTTSALLLLGPVTIQTFTLALLIGIVSGTYSSIFNASQLLVTWEEWSNRRKARRATAK